MKSILSQLDCLLMEDDTANRWPAHCLALLYENTSIASHARCRQRWLILVSLDVMTPRIALTCVFLIIGISAAIGAEQITRDALMEKTRHWKEPKVAIWYYIGSQDGRDFSSIMISVFPKFTLLRQARFNCPGRFLARRSKKTGL